MHIPKTGGNSLINLLRNRFSRDQFYFTPNFTAYARKIRDISKDEDFYTHFKKIDLSKYCLFDSHLGWYFRSLFLPNEIETITFVRNPIDQFISMYKQFHIHKNAYILLSKRYLSFEEFIFDPTMQKYLFNPQAQHFCSEKHLIDLSIDQHLLEIVGGWVFDIPLSADKMKTLTFQRLEECALIGVTESYNESIMQFCKKFNWCPPKSIPKLNRSPKQHEIVNISNEAYNKVKNLTELDHELYEKALQIHSRNKSTRLRFIKFFLPSLLSPKKISLTNTTVIPTQNGFRFPFSHGIVGDGWHQSENIESSIFRWNANKKAFIFLPFKLSGNIFTITICVIHSLQKKPNKNLKIKINGYKVNLKGYQDPNTMKYIFKGNFTKKVFNKQRDLIKITFIVPKLVSPVDNTSKDNRKLGIAIEEISVNYLG